MACNKTIGWKKLEALVPRFFFVLQVILAVWRVATLKGSIYWCMALSLLLLLIDTIYTLSKRNGDEFKWISTSFLCFLIAAVPPIWILELHRFDRYQRMLRAVNQTTDSGERGLSPFMGYRIPLYMTNDVWVKVLQQTFILLLIPTRWIIPRGPISKDRLSQILLVYVAIGSDIIELLDLYDLNAVMTDFKLYVVILSFWSLSLLQFILLLASSGSRRSRMAFIQPYEEPRKDPASSPTKGSSNSEDGRKFDGMEVFSLLMTLFLQDIPFICIRLYVMITFKELSNSLLFFVAKNFFVIVLQFYRIIVVTCCRQREDDDDSVASDEEASHRKGPRSSSDVSVMAKGAV